MHTPKPAGTATGEAIVGPGAINTRPNSVVIVVCCVVGVRLQVRVHDVIEISMMSHFA